MNLVSLRRNVLAAGVVLALGTGNALAVNFGDHFDGNWIDTAAVGTAKGVTFDYLPGPNQMFYAFFTYDGEGNQIWLANNFPVVDGQDSYADQAALQFTGGTFNVGGAPAAANFGTVDFTFGCDAIQANFKPAAASGLAAQSFNLIPLTRAVGGNFSGAGCMQTVSSCPAGTTASGDDCQLPASITDSLTLAPGKKYILRGQVVVEDGAVLTVKPGVTVQGSADTSSPNFLAVKAGGKLIANGTAQAPITFTGPEATPGSWAGLVMAGTSNCNESDAELGCQFEAIPEITFGGSNVNDSSGSLRYVRILWAGQVIREDEELNGLTLLGVGAGTTIEHVQVHGGLDDGFEMFGGTVNLRWVVASAIGDDMFDMDDGYQGRIQFALGYQPGNTDTNDDSNGVESDNDSSNPNLEPRTQPIVSNLTLIGAQASPNDGNEGMRIRRGSGGNYHAVAVDGFFDSCLNFNDSATFEIGGSATAQGDVLSMVASRMGNCAAGAFENADGEPYLVSAWFAAGAGNSDGDLGLDGYLPVGSSPLIGNGSTPSDPFFYPVDYIGAFAPGEDWTRGWTVPFLVD